MSDNPLTPLSAGGVGLFRRLFGPAASELGEVLADRVRLYRATNLNRMLAKAEQKIATANVAELPLRFSIPLIEHASIEDDPILSDMWASLLADASKGVRDEHHLILKVLSNLTPNSAALLAFLVGDFHTAETWYDELDWEFDWLQDLEKYVKDEVEPYLYYKAWEGEHSDLAQKLFEFEHDKPYWVFKMDLPLVMPDAAQAIDAGADPEEYGEVVMSSSVEDSSLQILHREQLVERRKGSIKLKHCTLKFSYVAATALGVELVKTCKLGVSD